MIWIPGERAIGERIGRVRRRGRVALLDPGGGKIAWAIASWNPDHAGNGFATDRLSISAAGSVPPDGYTAGEILDMEDFERALRRVIDMVEGQANCGRIDDVLIAVDGRDLNCHYARGDAAISGQVVTERDMFRAMRCCPKPNIFKDKVLLHALPVHYTIDDRDGIVDPRRLAGQRLTVDVVWVSIRRAIIDELSRCITGCGLKPAGFVAKPYATGLGCHMDTARGGACVDFGASTTGVSVFLKGQCVYASSLNKGGNDVTAAIAKGIEIDFAEAEQRKRALKTGGDPKVAEIMAREMQELFRGIRLLLDQADFREVGSGTIRLTGGASRIADIQDMAIYFGHKVETCPPRGVWWPSEDAAKPENATLAGLARFAREATLEIWDYDRMLSSSVTGFANRTFRWMGEAW